MSGVKVASYPNYDLFLLFLPATSSIYGDAVPSLCTPARIARLENWDEMVPQKAICHAVGILQSRTLFTTGPKARPALPYPFHDLRPEGCRCVVLVLADETSSGPIVVQ
jgi:hypothetical protein